MTINGIPVTAEDLLAMIRPDPRVILDERRQTVTLATGAEGYPYEVDLRTIHTPLDVLAWTYHLSEKKWTDRLMLRAFIACAAGAKGYPLHT